MDVRHLELLRELSVRGTLAAVAQATYRTPSAVSQQLRTAEREIGVRLVEHVGRGVRLTAEGQLLADSADEVGRVLAEVRARLDAARGEARGRVSIGTLPSAGTALLPGLLERLQGSAIELDVDDFDLAEADYAARTLDVDVVIAHSLTGDRPAGTDGLVARLVAREPIDVLLPGHHPLAAREHLRPEDLRGTTWVGVPPGYPFDSILVAVERVLDQPLERRIRLRDNQLVAALVGAGVGLALLPRFTTSVPPSLVLRPLEGVRSMRSIVALSRPDRHARLAVRTVVDLLEAVGQELATPAPRPGRRKRGAPGPPQAPGSGGPGR